MFTFACRRTAPAYYYTAEDKGLIQHRYVTKACQNCAIKQEAALPPRSAGSSGWEHDTLSMPCSTNSMSVRRRCSSSTKQSSVRSHHQGQDRSNPASWMKTLPRVASEMALHVLAYNLTRVMNIMGARPLMAAIDGIERSQSVTVFCKRVYLARSLSVNVSAEAFSHNQGP